MGLDEKILARLDELIMLGGRLIEAKYRPASGRGTPHKFGTAWVVDEQLAAQWGASCLTVLSQIPDTAGNHRRLFEEVWDSFPRCDEAQRGLGILVSAKSDYENGLLTNARILIEAEVFGGFLEQAEYLLQKHFYQPAAVVAGAVLEDGLRKLCARHNVSVSPTAKVETMNAELTRAGVYNGLVQKQVTMFADLRNKAAHGQWTEFTEADVTTILPQVRAFMVQHFG